MLTVIIRRKGQLVYVHSFENHKEAINHYAKIQVNGWLDKKASVELTNSETILTVKRLVPYYVR